MKKYVIRKAAFHYSDDCYYHHSWGIVFGDTIYEDYEVAYSDLLKLEREEYIKNDVGDFSCFHSSYEGRNFDETLRFKKFMEEQFGDTFFTTADNGSFGVKRDTFLPKTLTIEQVEKIRYLSGLKFYELVSFADEPIFYGIWGKTPFYKEDFFLCTLRDSQYFYNSYFEAFQAAINEAPDIHDRIEIKGTLAQISNTPQILQSFINLSNNISFNEEKKVLSFSYLDKKDWASLYPLLKKKPFEIRTLTFEEVQEFIQDDYTLR
jgi:hypothetical protein